jgi:hypothetical protein
MHGSLELLDGPGGLSAGPFPAILGTTLAIGDTQPVTIALDTQIPPGPWNARISLQSGLLERTAQATITFPEVGASVPAPAISARPAWLYPAIGALALLVLALVVGLTRKRARLRRSTRNRLGVSTGSTRPKVSSTASLSG